MYKTLIVSRFRENLDWITEIHHAFNEIIVYNKGGSFKSPDEVSLIVPLTNVGREGHTYAYHIVRNYSRLRGLLVFCQGNPAPHFDYRKKLVNLQETETYQPLSSRYMKKCCENGAPEHRNIPLNRVTMELLGHKFRPRGIWANGIFAVGASVVKARPVSLYSKIEKMLESSMDPIEGYCIERLWDEILNAGPPFSTL